MKIDVIWDILDCFHGFSSTFFDPWLHSNLPVVYIEQR